MKVVVIGGGKATEYLLKSLNEKKHNIVFINNDYDYCKNISKKYNVQALCGDGSKEYILEEADINKEDIVIAMTNKDSDNLVICQLAKKIYEVGRTFAIVSNPKNVDVFKKLGVDRVISSAYIVAELIEQVTTINEIHNCIPIEDGNIKILELLIKESYYINGKLLKDIYLSDEAIIGFIVRGSKSIIPNGNTRININDKLIILSSSNESEKIISNIVEGKKSEEEI